MWMMPGTGCLGGSCGRVVVVVVTGGGGSSGVGSSRTGPSVRDGCNPSPVGMWASASSADGHGTQRGASSWILCAAYASVGYNGPTYSSGIGSAGNALVRPRSSTMSGPCGPLIFHPSSVTHMSRDSASGNSPSSACRNVCIRVDCCGRYCCTLPV